ncbi:MAG: flagellar hook-associated protein FlgK [Rhodospirillales bacterium]|nr:flagellar hook-associated protein FlgK [Rhodospirillales bacterium]MCB9965571.1 flagellar hook-associated protein FlgK [Rhodospirillales bacterium]MCB9979812.1 flagellar hook-associated protein FlgK [Rhodospirillales bacterium]
MSLSALDAALSGLKISQQQLGVISNNIANVSTEGYTRKILPQSTQAINGLSVAVQSEVIIRNVDISLTRDVWTQVSSTSALDTKLSYLQQIENFHGAPDAEISFAAKIAALRDSFSALSDSPDDTFLLSSTVEQANTTANKINDFADLLTQMRNDAQSDLQISVSRTNDLLEQIAGLNDQIRFQLNTNRSAAQLQDFRDQVVKDLSQEIEISFFVRGDGVMVVQTAQGQELTGDQAQELVFSPVPVSTTNAYPDLGVSGLFLKGDPATTPGGVDLTEEALGGKIGALLELRDQSIPKYSAQIDEVAHKMALRFEAQGLRLFTDASGNVPADTPPVPDDPLTPLIDESAPVEYVGFAAEMRVNANIIADHTLLRSGTYGASVLPGSNEVIQRVLDFTFGEYEYQAAIGTVGFGAADVGGATLQDYLGLYSTNSFTGTLDLSAYADTNALVSAANGLLDDPNDVFRLTFDDPDLGLSVDLDVDLSIVAGLPGTGDFASDLVSYINTTAIPALPAADQTDLATMGVTVQVGPSGQLKILSRGDISITADPAGVPGGMNNSGLAFLGFSEGASSQAVDPYFDIQVGGNPAVRITIDRDDTETDLLAKLQAVSGLGVYDFIANPDGLGSEIRLRPGNNYTTPDFGGALRIIGGPFETEAGGTAQGLIDDTDSDGAGDTLALLPTGINIVTALFGRVSDTDGAAGFTAGSELSPISSVLYQSETVNGSGEYVSFRSQYLGPDLGVSTTLSGSRSLIDFGQKVLNKQTEDIVITQSRYEDESIFQETLEQQLMNESGVNLDEELSHLIVIQTAYAAAARAVSAIDDMFQELINAIR